MSCEGEVWRDDDIVIDSENVLELTCNMSADEFSSNLGTDRHPTNYNRTGDQLPNMIYAIFITNVLTVVKRCRTISVANNKDMICRKNLERRDDRRRKNLLAFVCWYNQCSILNIATVCICCLLGRRRIRIE